MMTAFFWFGWKINDGDNSSTRVLCFSLFFFTGANWQAGRGPLTHERNPWESEHLTFYI